MTTTPAPATIFTVAETDEIDAPELFRGTLVECKSFTAQQGRFLYVRREDGRVCFRLLTDAAGVKAERLVDARVYEKNGPMIERKVQPCTALLSSYIFGGGYTLELLPKGHVHRAAQERAAKKAGLKIGKFDESLDVSLAKMPPLVRELIAEGFEVADAYGRAPVLP